MSGSPGTIKPKLANTIYHPLLNSAILENLARSVGGIRYESYPTDTVTIVTSLITAPSRHST